MAKVPARATASMVASAPKQFSFSMRSFDLNGRTIPLAVWTPAARVYGEVSRPLDYPYAIDIGKIAAKLKVGWLRWLPRFDRPLPCGAAAWESLPSRAREGDTLVFAHGFLGSPYDLAHICEALACDGYTVLAPELPESLAASYRDDEGVLTREEIIATAREQVGGQRWGIFGHSAGAGSAIFQRGAYTLGRVALCGGLRGGYQALDDPIFLIASDGDGCNRFQPVPIRAILEAEADAGRPTTVFATLEEAYVDTSATVPRRGAFIFRATKGVADGAGDQIADGVADDLVDRTEAHAPLPCHISFLWSRSNEALIAILAPLLPLAKALGLFVRRRPASNDFEPLSMLRALRNLSIHTRAHCSPRRSSTLTCTSRPATLSRRLRGWSRQ